MTMSDESEITLCEWLNLTPLWETIDERWKQLMNEFFDDPNMTSYGENLGVYEIVDFYDRNTTVSYFF